MDCKKQSTADVCKTGILERPRYFPRQLITPVELTLEQTYFRDKLRRHNRLLHGWGVVCGAEICAVPNADGKGLQAWKVKVKPGYILGPYGDEIVIGKERILDLRVASSIGGPEDLTPEMSDPWCRPVYREKLPELVYVAVKYREIMTRQVRVQPAGCGCDDAPCEYSRFCDGYEFGMLMSCPESHLHPPELQDVANLAFQSILDCPDCPEDPWVVLGAVHLDSKGQVQGIDNCSYRRIVVSAARVWGRCTNGYVQINSVEPNKIEQGQTQEVTVQGQNFVEGIKVNMGAGVGISNISITDSNKIMFTVNVDSQAEVGSRVLVLTNPDCSMATYPIKITAKPA